MAGDQDRTHDRPRSWEVTEGPHRAPARAMLRAVGFSDDDFNKPQVAVASSWNEVTPCNYHLDKLAALAKEGVRQGGSVPIEFGTIAVSDGIAMGHEGMKASLMSRDLIADSVELVMHAERFDALVGIAGCDKSEPGMMMAMARLNLPSVYLYGGTILPGTYGDRDITLQDVFEAVGAHADPVPACTPRTRWRRWARRSGSPSRVPRPRRPWTTAARCSHARAASALPSWSRQAGRSRGKSSRRRPSRTRSRW
jgi:dihydroxy-acid dehydratase